MDFFQHQDQARARTGRLVVLFLLAIVCLVGLTYAMVLFLVKVLDKGHHATPGLWQPLLLLATVVGVLAVVGCGSLYKVSQLASGGEAVALMLGGVEVQPGTRDFHEKRLLNIVEEMALAAGVPVPSVYVLEEEGINAFAAGYTPGDAVVAVSRGCLSYLTRDEIQGVVAHEFSHILNGDMRLNIRLMGLIHGIAVISLVGSLLMEATRGRSSSSKDDNRAFLGILGFGLYILGIVGAFFGQLIRAAVSCQREFLADASAVQFTRYPDGIGGALKKIGGLHAGSQVNHPEASETAHMFFAAGVTRRFNQLFATHPPLEVRIRLIDPNWNGEFPNVRPLNEAVEKRAEVERKKSPRGGSLPTLPGLPQVPAPVVLGTLETPAPPTPLNAADPLEILGDIVPTSVRDALKDAFSARAIVYLLLLDRSEAVRTRQWTTLETNCDPCDLASVRRLVADVLAVPAGVHLLLVHLSVPTLRQMSPPQYQVFRAQVEQLVAADEQISLFEFCLQCVVLHHLDSAFGLRTRKSVRYHSPRGLTAPISRVFAQLAWAGHADGAAAQKAYSEGWNVVFKQGPALAMPGRNDTTLQSFAEALDKLGEGSPGVRKQLVAGCLASIRSDAVITPSEVDLLRAICSTLECPVPPLPSLIPS